MSYKGLFENIFGKLLDPLVRDTRRERAKDLLKNVYHMDDIDDLFPRVLDKKEITKHLGIIMQNYIGDDEKWGLLKRNKE